MAPIGKEGGVVTASKDEVEPLTVEKAEAYLREEVAKRLATKGRGRVRLQFLFAAPHFCLVHEQDPVKGTSVTYLLVAVSDGKDFYWLDPQGYAYEGGPEKIRPWAETDEGKMVCLFRGRGGGEVTTLKLSRGGDTDISAPPYGGETSVKVGERTFTFHFCGVSNPYAREMLRRYRVGY